MFVGKLGLLEEQKNTQLHMQLTDLARALTKRKELEVEGGFHSHYAHGKGIITYSQFWRDWPETERAAGMKSDVLLRALGSAWFSGSPAMRDYLRFCASCPLPKLANQLFALCEDMRLERICRRLRPGTARLFAVRQRLYGAYFQRKLRSHARAGERAEALFVLVYGWFTGGAMHWPEGLSDHQEAGVRAIERDLTVILPLLEQAESAVHTAETAACCAAMIEALAYRLERDAEALYFSAQPDHGVADPLPAGYQGQLQRAKPLAGGDAAPPREAGQRLPDGERLPTWHRETKDRSPGLLRFELERGRPAAAAGSSPREGDAADQALAFAQGRSLRARHTGAASGERRRSSSGGVPQAAAETAVNAKATAVWLAPVRPSAEQEAAYRRMCERVAPLAKQLQRAMRRALQQKRTGPRGGRSFGRLDKRLTRVVTEEAPRLFYARQAPVPQLDAAFALLVDCSASMRDKMDETKLGLALFHETLRPLRIPHEVVGFWEDADRVTEREAPNLFQLAFDFAASGSPGRGAALLQLEPQQDNRDGFAIRRMTARLLRRPERQRVLLVFSDGEPSAADYHEAGILDTCEAVLEARRLGIKVISVFLASGQVHDTQRQTMRNMYGRSSVVVPDVRELPQRLAPILRKLLLKSIF